MTESRERRQFAHQVDLGCRRDQNHNLDLVERIDEWLESRNVEVVVDAIAANENHSTIVLTQRAVVYPNRPKSAWSRQHKLVTHSMWVISNADGRGGWRFRFCDAAAAMLFKLTFGGAARAE